MPTNEIIAADGTPILITFFIVLVESFRDLAFNGFLQRKNKTVIRKKDLIILFFHPNHSCEGRVLQPPTV